MPRVVHFEISVNNPKQTAKFYVDTFGWKIEKWEGPVDYWLITTGEESEPGINGAIKIKEKQEQESTTNTIEVPSIDEYMKKIEQNGGKILMPKMTIPGVGYHTYCQDPEGTIFGIMESDENAK